MHRKTRDVGTHLTCDLPESQRVSVGTKPTGGTAERAHSADERPDDADANERRRHVCEERRSTVTCSRVTPATAPGIQLSCAERQQVLHRHPCPRSSRDVDLRRPRAPNSRPRHAIARVHDAVDTVSCTPPVHNAGPELSRRRADHHGERQLADPSGERHRGDHRDDARHALRMEPSQRCARENSMAAVAV